MKEFRVTRDFPFDTRPSSLGDCVAIRSEPFDKAQGERIITCVCDQAIPFVVRLSNHERDYDTVSLAGEGKDEG